MQIGMIGLGRMGANMASRLMAKGHECVVYARCPEAMKEVVAQGATGTTDLADFVARLAKPRTVWMMVPAASADADPACCTRGRRGGRIGHEVAAARN